MKGKKKEKWYETTRFTERIRYDPKWKENLKKEKGQTLAAKLDKILEEKFGNDSFKR